MAETVLNFTTYAGEHARPADRSPARESRRVPPSSVALLSHLRPEPAKWLPPCWRAHSWGELEELPIIVMGQEMDWRFDVGGLHQHRSQRLRAWDVTAEMSFEVICGNENFPVAKLDFKTPTSNPRTALQCKRAGAP